MQVQVSVTQLQFRHPFVLAAGTRASTPVVFLRVEINGKTAWAEAALPPYFELTPQMVMEKLNTLPLHSFEHHLNNPVLLNEKLRAYYHLPEPVNALLVAAAENFHDFNVQPGSYKTTLTVSASPGVTAETLLTEQEKFSAIKIKTGTGNDKDFIEYILKHTHKPFCIDVNRGWKNRDEAAAFCDWLTTKDCFLIEQPFAANDYESHHWLQDRTSIPIIADESICTYAQLEENYQAFSGVNIKLLKCGGPVEAAKMIEFARTKNLIVLLGCMSESSLGCATSARLAHKANYVDLDGPYLIKDDPFTGYSIEEGKIKITETGIQPTQGFLNLFYANAVTF